MVYFYSLLASLISFLLLGDGAWLAAASPSLAPVAVANNSFVFRHLMEAVRPTWTEEEHR